MAPKKPTKTELAKIVALSMAALSDIVAAGPEGIFTPAHIFEPLVADELVEINPALTNEAGEVATRATAKGIELINPTNTEPGTDTGAPSAPAAKPVVAKSNFVIEDAVPVPAASGRGRSGNTYPFELLEKGQSFFVPNTEAKPNAAKSLASTVSSATARYAVPAVPAATKINRKGREVPVMVETRKFIVRSVEENGVKGARVWRTL